MTLYVVPAPISENIGSIPQSTIEVLHSVKYFIVERIRTTRRYISSSGYEGNIDDLVFFELDKRNPDNIPKEFFEPLINGYPMALISEAGMPGIADPGAKIVAAANKLGAKVVPLVGPSSLFLALAASGLQGQTFKFEGYLPIKLPELKRKLKHIESDIQKDNCTYIFIETPYRNNKLREIIINSVNDNIKLCIASEITGKNEHIATKSIREWKKEKDLYDLHKKTCIFLLGK